MTDEELAVWFGEFVNRILSENGMDDEFELDSDFVADMLLWMKKTYKEDT